MKPINLNRKSKDFQRLATCLKITQVASSSNPLGLDRHIQAIFARMQWICQSTASGH